MDKTEIRLRRNTSCGKCRVKLLSGSLVSEKTRHITDRDYADGWRLSCVGKTNEERPVIFSIPMGQAGIAL